MDFSNNMVSTCYPRYYGMGLIFVWYLKNRVYFKAHERFQFIPSFIAACSSRSELFHMDFLKNFNDSLEYSLEH